MKEGEPKKETVNRGDMYFLWHPSTENLFSGCGLTMKCGSREYLVGILMIDRPQYFVDFWLSRVEEAFGEYELEAMTESGERSILCQMQIEHKSQDLLRKLPSSKAAAIKSALHPLLINHPAPSFLMQWDEESRSWCSNFILPNELSPELRELFENIGHVCLAVEANIGIVHVCHASDSDIDGFADKPVLYQWQLIELPTAPLIRLEIVILDNPFNPFKFESFLNIAEEDQAQVLYELANQSELYLAFFGDDLNYRYSKVIPHDEQQWQKIDELVAKATSYWNDIPINKRDFDLAKTEFMRRFV